MQEDNGIAIWCLNTEHLKKRSLEILAHEFGTALKETQNLINEKLFEVLFYQNNKSLVFPVEPFRMNRRYSLQQSIFLSTGTSAAPFMEQLLFLGDEMSKAIVKLEIPSTEKKVALRDLQTMNLHRSSLFPDLDGYALSLKFRYNNMKAPEEVQKEVTEKYNDRQYPFIP
jgi:hypothetical protein